MTVPEILLAALIFETELPYLLARPESVSPFFTVWRTVTGLGFGLGFGLGVGLGVTFTTVGSGLEGDMSGGRTGFGTKVSVFREGGVSFFAMKGEVFVCVPRLFGLYHLSGWSTQSSM